MKSTEELETDFKWNEKMLTSLNSNIDDLFKKISQLTEEVVLEKNSPLKLGKSQSAA